MKKTLSLALALLVAGFLVALATDTASAQTGNGQGGRSQSGTGMSGMSFDDDGDGILNGQDPDYVRPGDGTGKKLGKSQSFKGGKGNGGFGLRNGTGTGIGPRDGSGFGRGAGNGSGVCDGSGPKGNGRGK